MKKIAIILVSPSSLAVAKAIKSEAGKSDVTLYYKGEIEGCERITSVSDTAKELFGKVDALVFICAMGICVRSISGLVNDKYEDPAVVCVDSTGHYVIPVLSGHVGGANQLARFIASVTGGEAVITTQSDNHGLWALDTLARDYGWQVTASHKQMNDAISLFVGGRKTALVVECKVAGTDMMLDSKPEHVDVFFSYEEFCAVRNEQHLEGKEDFALLILVSPRIYEVENISYLQFFPPVLHLGIGCQRLTPKETAIQIIEEVTMAGYAPESISTIGTIELKKDEPVLPELLQFCKAARLCIYTADRLNEMEVPNPSEKVFQTTGTYGVAEAAALAGASDSRLVIEKHKGVCRLDATSHYTYALAVSSERKQGGHIEIVGAGPGDPELVSVRGRKFLERADLILYAGSLVPRELTYCAKQGAVVRSSASMNLEEQFELMKSFYDKGLLVVRLHTGDPCIYGAIQEQMNFFDKYGMSYHITPGISSFQAAAAELRSQFTIPERVQTIILTRGEGRTPMPEKEKLHLLARSQSTMCIFLSAGIVRQVQAELLECYPPETPVAACYKLTWKEQRIYRGKLSELVSIVEGNSLDMTTMIVVGEAIDNRSGLSKLYDGGFTHLFRTAKVD
ncbi:MAG: precorrin-4 C(11)-methyltransferase [Bacteroides sp.]|nr:precorrin-4 C(11)-methyltransferase [Roseburia sp.]MCM1346554.1 precorrin-4 C(11)-methyltransferase [Bacteroides sp.]MCM1421094.1 precorrin-4 C(11)-methyltransferase [Bacteroides sp.]